MKISEDPLRDAIREQVRAQIAETLGLKEHVEDTVGRVVHEALLRPAQAFALAGISVPQGYRLVASGDFPKPVAISEHARGFLASEVMAWIEGRRIARDTGADAHLRVINPNIGKGRARRPQATQEAA
jgi:predicted DNA-binding transcriptional regulator AlpA